MSVGFSKGLVPFGTTNSDVVFYDNKIAPDPRVLNGGWGGASVGATSGAVNSGIAVGGTALGKATTNIESSKNAGTTNIGVGVFLGKVTSVKSSWSYCRMSEKPKCRLGGYFDKNIVTPPFNPYPIYRPTVKEPTPKALPYTPPTSDQIKISFP